MASNNPNRPEASLATELPSELLAKIFLYNKGEPYTKYGKLTLSEEAITDIKCSSQVCRHWRTAALSCPFLWNEVAIFDRPDSPAYANWIQLMFERSHPLGIAAEIRYPPTASSDVDGQSMHDDFFETDNMRLLFSNLHNIWRLKITMETSNTLPPASYFEERLLQSGSSLKVLEYSINQEYENLEDPYQARVLSNPILSEDTTLSELKLFNVKFTPAFAHHCLSSLTRLEVGFHAEKSYGPSTTTQDWLEILDCMPQLVVLRVDDWAPGGSRIRPDTKVVELNHLQTFDLDRDIGECVDFLTKVKYPTSASLSLRCRNTTPGWDWTAIAIYLAGNFDFAAQNRGLSKVEISAMNSTFNVYVRDEETMLCLQVQLWPHIEDDFVFSAYNPLPTDWMKGLRNAKELSLTLLDRTDAEMDAEITQEALRSILLPFHRANVIWTDSIDALLWAFEPSEWLPEGHEEQDLAGSLLPSAEDIYCLNQDEWQDQELWIKFLNLVRRRRSLERDILLVGVSVDNLNLDFCQSYMQQLRDLGVEVFNSCERPENIEEVEWVATYYRERIKTRTVTYSD